MEVILSYHTQIRLYERGLDAWQVKAAAKSPSWQKRQKDGSIKARKSFDNKTIEVVFLERNGKRVIKTAYLCG